MLSLRSIASTLVKIYPAAPANADAWLAEEIRRAACDPGALGVFRRAALAGHSFVGALGCAEGAVLAS